MSTNPRKNRRLKTRILSKARWAGYAAAGAATLLGTHESAEAGIFYSGPLSVHLDGSTQEGIENTDAWGIDLPGGGSVDLLMAHQGSMSNGTKFGIAYANTFFSTRMGKIAGIKRTPGTVPFYYADRLEFGDFVSVKADQSPREFWNMGTLAASSGFSYSQFLNSGPGYIGFSFDAGGGTQYGWLQVNMNDGAPHNDFTILGYAYAGVGESIYAGQNAVPEPGSLGLLAIGGIGLLLWRRARRSSQPKA